MGVCCYNQPIKDNKEKDIQSLKEFHTMKNKETKEQDSLHIEKKDKEEDKDNDNNNWGHFQTMNHNKSNNLLSNNLCKKI